MQWSHTERGLGLILVDGIKAKLLLINAHCWERTDVCISLPPLTSTCWLYFFERDKMIWKVLLSVHNSPIPALPLKNDIPDIPRPPILCAWESQTTIQMRKVRFSWLFRTQNFFPVFLSSAQKSLYTEKGTLTSLGLLPISTPWLHAESNLKIPRHLRALRFFKLLVFGKPICCTLGHTHRVYIQASLIFHFPQVFLIKSAVKLIFNWT